MEDGVAVFPILLETVAGAHCIDLGEGFLGVKVFFGRGLFFFVKTVVDESFYCRAGIVGVVTGKFH